MLSSQVACMLFRPSYYIKALVHRQFSTPQNSQLSPRIWSAITLEQKTKIMIIKLCYFFSYWTKQCTDLLLAYTCLCLFQMAISEKRRVPSPLTPILILNILGKLLFGHQTAGYEVPYLVGHWVWPRFFPPVPCAASCKPQLAVRHLWLSLLWYPSIPCLLQCSSLFFIVTEGLLIKVIPVL